jgi:hypothetical protein
MAKMTDADVGRGDRADLWTTGAAGVLGAGGAIGVGVQRLIELFGTPGGVTVAAPVTAEGADERIGSVDATATEVTFFAPDVNAVSVGALGAEVVLTALGCVAIVALVGVLVLRAARDRAFSRGSSGLVTAIAIVLLAVTSLGVLLRTMGLNGAFAAVDAFDRFDQQAIINAAIPLYLVAIGIAALGLTFRRGERLRRDTEGLV